MRYLTKREQGGKHANKLTKRDKQVIKYTKKCQEAIDNRDNNKVIIRKKGGL